MGAKNDTIFFISKLIHSVISPLTDLSFFFYFEAHKIEGKLLVLRMLSYVIV